MTTVNLELLGMAAMAAVFTWLVTITLEDVLRRTLYQVVVGVVINNALLMLFSLVPVVAYWVSLVAINWFTDWICRRFAEQAEKEMVEWRAQNTAPIDPFVHVKQDKKAQASA